MNHTTETIATLDTSLTAWHHGRERRTCRLRRSEGQSSVRPVAVVVVREHVEDLHKMLLVDDGLL